MKTPGISADGIPAAARAARSGSGSAIAAYPWHVGNPIMAATVVSTHTTKLSARRLTEASP